MTSPLVHMTRALLVLSKGFDSHLPVPFFISSSCSSKSSTVLKKKYEKKELQKIKKKKEIWDFISQFETFLIKKKAHEIC